METQRLRMSFLNGCPFTFSWFGSYVGIPTYAFVFPLQVAVWHALQHFQNFRKDTAKGRWFPKRPFFTIHIIPLFWPYFSALFPLLSVFSDA